MTIFMGSWEKIGYLYKIATITACASIVVTAVYILRAAGKSIMGPVTNNEHLQLSDASWNEKAAAGLLILAILAMGITPFWIYDLVHPGSEVVIQRIAIF
jgi:NADH-quinone oxidoreductase subunit M